MPTSIYSVASSLGFVSAIPFVMGSFYTNFRDRLVDQVAPERGLADVEVFRPPIPVGDSPLVPLEIELRAVDQALFGMMEQPLAGEIDQDVVPGADFRIDLIRGKAASAGVATVDLDRDGRWDERWSFEGAIVRMVATNDDGAFLESYEWTGTNWRTL